MKILLLIIGAVLGACGAKLVYDARELTNQFFYGNDKNRNVLILRIIGLLFIIVDIVLIYYFM